MARLAACTAGFGALWAAPAAAQVRALAPREGFDLAGPALAGGRVFWTRVTDRAVRVLAAPVDGGSPALVGRARVSRPEAISLAAGPEGLALRVLGRRESLFTGPLAGPLARLGRIARGPGFVEIPDLWVSSAGVVSLERRGRGLRVVVHAPSGAPRVLKLPRGADAAAMSVARGFLAVHARRAVVVLNVATGAVVRRLSLGAVLDDSVTAVGVSPGGDVAFTGESVGGVDLLEWAPAGSAEPTPVAAGDNFGLVATADGRIAFATPDRMRVDGRRVVVLEPRPSAPPRVLFRSPPAFRIERLAFDGTHVAWGAQGCQLVSPAEPSASSLIVPPGPCVRTQVAVETFVPVRPARRHPRYPVAIGCLTAPTRRCHVVVSVRDARLRAVGRLRATVRRGARRRLEVPLRARFAARLRRSQATLAITYVRVVDPDGRTRVVGPL